MVADMTLAARDTKLWSHIHRIELCLSEIYSLDGFSKGARYVGKPLPCMPCPESIETIQLLLTAELVRLKKKAAP